MEDTYHSNDLEYDIRNTEWLARKIKGSREYAGDLYGALCNNMFQKNDVWPILQDKTWSCSWRYAGGIVADIIGEGDYMDWYARGNESIITEEIEQDLDKIGWMILRDKYDYA